jgi:Bacterial extracellular solute-binding protein
LNQVAPNFEQATGNKLKIGYSLIADIRKRMLEGEAADVIILSRPVMDELDKQQKFASGSMTNVAGTPVALAIRAGSPKPDISTVEALKRTLLDAKSIVYADPSKGGASGVYFAHVLDRLGIADQLKSKTILVPGPQAAEVVAKGEAEIRVRRLCPWRERKCSARFPASWPARHTGPPPLARLPKHRRRRNRLSNSSPDRSLGRCSVPKGFSRDSSTRGTAG